MNLTDIALNNLRRRKLKMVFLLFGMVFGVATIVTLFSINQAMQEQMTDTIQGSGTSLLVRPESDNISFTYAGINVGSDLTFDVKELKESSVDKLEGIEGIDVISPKLLGVTQIEGEDRVIVGLNFEQELAVKTHWTVVADLPTKDNEILIGSEVAMKKRVGPGDSLNFAGKEHQITGVIAETGQEEDGLIFMNLGAGQKILDQEGQLSFIEVSAFRNQEVTEENSKALMEEVKASLPETRVTALQQALDGRMEMVDRFRNFAWVVSGIVLIIGAVIVGTTMMSSVKERTREIGIFRAIGFRRSHITRIILTEAGIVSSISGLIGYILGMVTAATVAPIVAQAEVQLNWSPLLAIGVLILATVVGILASIHPAKKAAELDPNEALRFI